MKKEHWYFTTIESCPVCGRTKKYRERRYGRRPWKATLRYAFVEVYDWCEESAI